jgi:serine-type D-Ala-D-Ala carboxypeptidase (penicillin-binding protein 5/6)
MHRSYRAFASITKGFTFMKFLLPHNGGSIVLSALSFIVSTFACVSLLLSSTPAWAQAAPPPAIAGKAWFLLDMTSGQVLVSEQPDAKVEPASLTKLMTAYLTFAALRDKKITPTTRPVVSPLAYAAIGSRMFVDPKAPATVDELLSGMIIQSGNDASIILAEAVGGSEPAFVQMMNRQAQQLGMKNTQFANSTGLPDASLFSTARDLATLASRLIVDFPEQYAQYYNKKSYSYNNISQENRNRLLFIDPTVDGVKTGFTEAAGYCLIASSKRDQAGIGSRRLLSVVLGTSSMAARATESQKLLAWGFQNFDLARFYPTGQTVGSYEVWKGKVDKVAGVVDNGLLVTVPKGQVENLKAEIERLQPLIAPIAKGQRIGTVRIKLVDKVVAEKPLIANDAIEQAGIFGRAIDTIKLWMR